LRTFILQNPINRFRITQYFVPYTQRQRHAKPEPYETYFALPFVPIYVPPAFFPLNHQCNTDPFNSGGMLHQETRCDRLHSSNRG